MLDAKNEALNDISIDLVSSYILAAFQNIKEIFEGTDTEQVMSRILKTPISTTIEFTKLVKHCQESVNHIECPTLTIHGNDDLIVPTEATDYVYNSIKSTTNILVNVKKLNHECFTTNKSNEIKQISEVDLSFCFLHSFNSHPFCRIM